MSVNFILEVFVPTSNARLTNPPMAGTDQSYNLYFI